MLPESASPWTGVMILTDEAGQSLVTLLTPWWNIHGNSGSCCKFPKKVWKQHPSIALQNNTRAWLSWRACARLREEQATMKMAQTEWRGGKLSTGLTSRKPGTGNWLERPWRRLCLFKEHEKKGKEDDPGSSGSSKAPGCWHQLWERHCPQV